MNRVHLKPAYTVAELESASQHQETVQENRPTIIMVERAVEGGQAAAYPERGFSGAVFSGFVWVGFD